MSSPIPHSLSVFHCDPAPITEFDDSDLYEEASAPVVAQSRLQLKDKHVPIIRQSVLIASLLEQLCSLYETDKVKSQKLYYVLCDQLAKLGIISPVAYLKEFTAVHTQYRQTLYNIIQASLLRLDSKPAFPNHEIPPTLISGNQEFGINATISDPKKVFQFNTSRYQREFDEIGRVGSGGYGNVFHAQSKIDGQDYAIKKITLKGSLINSKSANLTREVHILARLRHKNIVRYHNAWYEHAEEKPKSDENHDENGEFSISSDRYSSTSKQAIAHTDSFLWKSSQDGSPSLPHFPLANLEEIGTGDSNKRSQSKFWGDSSASETSVSGLQEKSRKIKFSISPQNSDTESDMIFQHSNSGSSKKCSVNSESPPKETILTHGVRRDMDLNMGIHKVQSFIITQDMMSAKYTDCVKAPRNQSSSGIEDHRLSEQNQLLPISVKAEHLSEDTIMKSKLVLYIQMELCQTSLKHWLSVRNRNISLGRKKLCEGTSLHIMKQVTAALLFIHSKGLIHRDVKPPNIFLNGIERPHVLLGDFGLAKSDLESLTPSDDGYGDREGLRRYDSHTSGVGTTTYAAPEQLTEDTYDSKVDMYSLGIVLYELWNPFGTAMERARHVKQLRKHIIPNEFALKHPQIGKLVSSLLHHDPKSRPSADEIFQGDFFEKSKDRIIKDQSTKILALEKENRDLKLRNKKLQRLLNSKLPP